MDRVSTPGKTGGVPPSEEYNNKVSNINNNTNISSKDDTYDFDSFWNKYGKKIDKGGCLSKWKSLSQSARTLILHNLDRNLGKFDDPQYQPHPKTFINYVKRNPDNWINEIVDKPNRDGSVSDDVWEKWRKTAEGGM